ncbi:MAG: DMT family transporter [Anaerolineales bacterium]|nr:DMT family transporter [Anaerolineales bacterium]MCZ2122296.1 DMT family transporter [Anaerolineales bacterium]
MQSNKFIPYLALAVGISALSLSAMFVRWAEAPGPITAFYRVLFATIFFAPFLIQQRKKFGKLEKRSLWFPIVAGAFTAFDFSIWNTAAQHTTAAKVTLLGNTSPLWVALAAFFIFREKLKISFWVGLVLTLLGAAFVVGVNFAKDFSINAGDLLASVAAIFYALYQLTTQRGRKYMDPLRYTWIVGATATIFIFFINLFLGNSFSGYSAQTWLVFIASALVSQSIGYLTIAYALGHLPASVVSPTLIGQPVITALLAIPLLGEMPTREQWIGGALALAGIYLVNQARLTPHSETPNA